MTGSIAEPAPPVTTRFAKPSLTFVRELEKDGLSSPRTTRSNHVGIAR